MGSDHPARRRQGRRSTAATNPEVAPRKVVFVAVPAAMSDADGAAYIGVSRSLFRRLITTGDLPGPRKIHGRSVWLRADLDAYLASLAPAE